MNQKLSERIENIVVDMGKNEVKAIRFSGRGEIIGSVNFDSVMQRHLTKPTYSGNVNPNKYMVKYKNKYYEIGDELEDGTHSDENTKLNLHHKLCLFLAVGLLIDNDKPFVNITVGLPASHLANQKERERFEEMLKEETAGPISIEINGQQKVFNITKIIPESEGLAIIPRLKLGMKKNKYDISVIDIGGHNFNARTFNAQGMAKTNIGISEEQVGINGLLNDFHNELYINLEDKNRRINANDLKRFIKERKLDDDIVLYGYEEDSSEFIDEFVKNYIQTKIISKLSSHRIKVYAKGVIYLFTGGGSNLLKPYLEEMLEENKDYVIFSETAKWDNCLSLMLNYLFNTHNSNRKKIFDTICEESKSKLNNGDKILDVHLMSDM